jgi:hypothetical protein
MMLIVIALVAAQLATGSRLLHFCPVSPHATSPGNSSEESHHEEHGHFHAYLGSALVGTSHHHLRAHHHGKNGHTHSHAHAPKRSSRTVVGYPVPLLSEIKGGVAPVLAEEVNLQGPGDGHTHACSLFSAAKLTSCDRGLIEAECDPVADFSAGTPGWRGVYVTGMEVSFPLWPRPPTVTLDHKPTNSRLATLCRFLL